MIPSRSRGRTKLPGRPCRTPPAQQARRAPGTRSDAHSPGCVLFVFVVVVVVVCCNFDSLYLLLLFHTGMWFTVFRGSPNSPGALLWSAWHRLTLRVGAAILEQLFERCRATTSATTAAAASASAQHLRPGGGGYVVLRRLCHITYHNNSIILYYFSLSLSLYIYIYIQVQ